MLSKDARFESSGVGTQTRIPYNSDFQYYKSRLTKLYHSPDSSDWVQTVLETWDRELFSHHNKQKGHILDGNAETIDIDVMEGDADASEIAEDMASLRLWSAQQTNARQTDDSETVLAGPHHIPPPDELQRSDDDNSSDIYGDEAPIPPRSTTSAAIPAALNLPAPSYSSDESDSDEAAPQKQPSSSSILPSKSLPPLLSNNNAAPRQATSSVPISVDDSDGSLSSGPEGSFTNRRPATSGSSAPAAALPKPLPAKKPAPAKKPTPAKKPAAVPVPRVTRRRATETTVTATGITPPDLIDTALAEPDVDPHIDPIISGSHPEIAKELAANKPKRGRAAGSKKSNKG